MLSLLCFLRRLHEFTAQRDPWRGVLATDSQSLLDTIRGHYQHPHDKLTMTDGKSRMLLGHWRNSVRSGTLYPLSVLSWRRCHISHSNM